MIEITIIIPHYNSPESLQILLDSIPILDSIQVLVVDDKSIKGLEKYNILINSENYRHVTFLTNGTNKKGAGVCRNIGLKTAIGKWILFADADDFFFADFYDIVCSYFSSDYDVVYFTPTSIEADTKKASDRHIIYATILGNYIAQQNLEDELKIKYLLVGPWSKLIKRKFLIENRIDFDDTIVANDVMFSVKVGHFIKNFFVSPQIIYCITKTKGSLEHSISEENYNTRLNVFINQYQYIKTSISRKEFVLLKLNGRWFLTLAMKYGFSVRKIIQIIFKMKKNNIKIIEKRLFNPILIFKRSINLYKKGKTDKSYYIYK